ncbi:MAG TPA: hypothetical protein VJ842_16640 [Pyrinomonadaceae bacterium]|nr:hypothetical protein [Pyrinomonadaceae bacterium]
MTNHNSNLHAERTLDARVKLYYDLHVPPETPAPLVVALHGYGSNKSWMMREARHFAPERFAVAALQGMHQHLKEPREAGGALRYGFGWLTNFHAEDSVAVHHRALLDIIGQLTGEGVADPARIFLLGFSQTCALNYRFAFTHAEVLRGVVGICGGMPGDWETSELYQNTDAAVLHLAGARDEFYTPERVSDYAARLSERARDVEFKSYDAGHELTLAMREDVYAWLESKAVDAATSGQ